MRNTWSHQVCLGAAEPQQSALDKPIDLFKAIFENEDETSEEEEEASEAGDTPAPLQPQPTAASAPATATAAVADHHGPQTHQQLTGRESQLGVPLAVKAGEAQQPQAKVLPMQTHQQAAPEQVQRPLSESQAPFLHQPAALMQAPEALDGSELRRHRISGKKRKHREEEKQKSHKKRHKKGKDKKSSGVGLSVNAFAFANAQCELPVPEANLLLCDPLD